MQLLGWAVAMGIHFAASMRAVLSKRAMGMSIGENMGPGNLHAVVAIMTSVMFLPLSIAAEGPAGRKILWDGATGYLLGKHG